MKPSTSINRCLSSMDKPCRLSKPLVTPAMSARKSLLKRIQRQELKKLQSLLPTSSVSRRRQLQQHNGANQSMNELAIVEEACRYIDQLHSTILARIQSGTLSQNVLERLNVVEIQRIQQIHFARSQQSNDSSNRIQPVLRENASQNLRLLPKMFR